jgi:NAD(P) transhydrogenase subunit alpha
MLAFLVQDGKLVLNREDPIVASTLTTIGKHIVHAGALESGL